MRIPNPKLETKLERNVAGLVVGPTKQPHLGWQGRPPNKRNEVRGPFSEMMLEKWKGLGPYPLSLHLDIAQ